MSDSEAEDGALKEEKKVCLNDLTPLSSPWLMILADPAEHRREC
jgi:hypothetical protein